MNLQIGDFKIKIEAADQGNNYNKHDTQRFLMRLGDIIWNSSESDLNYSLSETAMIEKQWFNDIAHALYLSGYFDDPEV